jgi:6-phosphogluconolactonase
MTPSPIVEVADIAGCAFRVARFIAARASSASGPFGLCLSGGSTPKYAHEALAALFGGDLDWQKFRLFWGDERFVPPDHPDSNFRMAREALIDHVPIPAAQVHPVPTNSASPEEAAASYEATLQGYARSRAAVVRRDVAWPRRGRSHCFAVS